jgi:integrase
LYNEGWRSGEGKTLEWSDVDLSTNMIPLLAEKSKSKKPPHLPIIGELLEVIKRHLVVGRWIVPKFHRRGKPVASFQESIQGGCC